MSLSGAQDEPQINVRNIISLFENQTITVRNEHTNLVKRTKSMGNLTRKSIYKSAEKIIQDNHPELTQLENQVKNLQSSMKTYKEYSKESHIYFQNEIFLVLTQVINLESQDAEISNKKRELIDEVKQLNKSLNLRLPSGGIDKKATTAQQSLTKATAEIANKIKEDDEKDVLDASVPSVKKLKDLFEKKSNEKVGLNVIAATNKTPQRGLSFNTSDYKYIPYAKAANNNEDDVQKARVVHNASIQRSVSVSVGNLRAYFEPKSKTGITRAVSLDFDVDKDPSVEDDVSEDSVSSTLSQESLVNGSTGNIDD